MRALPPEPDGLPADDGWIHPLDAAALRAPIPNGGVRVIVLDSGAPPASATPDEVGQGLLSLIRGRNRPADAFVVATGGIGWARAIEQGLADGSHPIILITSAQARWTAAHLDPLLKAIDHRDHVIGQRPLPLVGRLRRWCATFPWRFLFAVPVRDVFSPCRLHRRVALEAIVLQSSTRLVDLEILAKATFLTQVIEEVDVPPLAAPPGRPIHSRPEGLAQTSHLYPRLRGRRTRITASERSAGRS